MPKTDKARRYGEGREALLAAVVHVVADKGLRGLTYRAVAERAGVNNTLIAHHFGSRDALLEAAMQWASERSIQLSDLSATEEVDEDFARALVDMVASDPDLQLFQFEMIFESRRRPELRPAVLKLYNSYIGSLENALMRRGYTSPASLARAIFAALDGLVIQQLTVADPESIYAAVVRVGELLASQPHFEHAEPAGPATRIQS
ncbi:TetR/AcrR family transcriptional regulator [Arthrobacter mobilis]|uniref:TetR/AcrR family transcriptional regulator n=1 Tax=Arthrobacter mobilis TaxID=2724944 RepID=A0A7X6K2F0_9MICC|nr:TetR family transcriptional regulator [Arthrobacter mobilis]NKX53122.1 TetR/AcrR family transcriptional regulator [Arthrobacter mobilis]